MISTSYIVEIYGFNHICVASLFISLLSDPVLNARQVTPQDYVMFSILCALKLWLYNIIRPKYYNIFYILGLYCTDKISEKVSPAMWFTLS